MRRTLVGVSVAVCLVSSSHVNVGAQVAPAQMSSNVEYLGTIPLEAGTWSTARVVGKHLYVGGSKSFSIYDIAEPASPRLMSHTPTGVQFVNEDLDTNGKVLLMS